MNKRLLKPVTIKAVAEKAGVNPSTVSRILSNSPNLKAKKETIDRVRDIANELNYRPDFSARSLRLKQTFALNMYIPTVASPVFPEIINGAEDACRKHGYTLFMSHLDKRAVQERVYLNLLSEGRTDGLLIASTLIEDSVIQDLSKQTSNFVLINRRSTSDANHVAIDDVEGARLAVNYLVERGHKKIAFLSGPLMFDTAIRRFQGFRQALHENGLEYDANYVEETDWHTYKGGQDGMSKILSRKKEPTAVFVSNLMSCVGAIAAIHNANLRIPEDISVIGFHDAPLAEMLFPSLTVVKMPLYEMGYQGAENLIAVLKGNEINSSQLLTPLGIIERKSTASLG